MGAANLNPHPQFPLSTDYEISPAVKEDFKEIDKLFDEDLPFKIRSERQLALFPDLLKKHPTDLHVRRCYLETRLGPFALNREALLGQFREQMEKNPNDPSLDGK